jgi:hypothetical protein
MFSLTRIRRQAATLIMAGVVAVSSVLGSGIAFADPSPANVEASPSSAVPGETITVTGVGYPAFVTVSNLSIGTTSVHQSPIPSTDASGSFTIEVSVPPVCGGPQVLLVTAGGVTSSTTLTVLTTNLAPNPSFESANFSTTGPEIVGWAKESKGTSAKIGLTKFATDGNYAVYVYASKSANKGWPGLTTKEIICVDPTKEYTFSASYYAPGNYPGIPWMDMTLFDAAGKRLGAVSTGSSPNQVLNEWHEMTYTFNPGALKKYFPDVAGVKLGLKLSLNYGVAGIPEGKTTLVAYDNVKFEVVESD